MNIRTFLKTRLYPKPPYNDFTVVELIGHLALAAAGATLFLYGLGHCAQQGVC